MESDALPLFTNDDSREQPTPKVCFAESTISAVPVAGNPNAQRQGVECDQGTVCRDEPRHNLELEKLHILGPDKSITTCHICHKDVQTTIKHTITSRTHITAALCSTLFALCCIPCCIYMCCNSAKNTDHFCPNCRAFLGTYEK